ncbi:patatin-like phospholipase family protein [Pontibacillus litoralis]|uniref:Esterase n=1 Tax=Pontibacillus litoralis JSM 072002 TaxID=1385512 RepID=A0A0A5GBU3_9BACI|nr:patatin-like phospholipase family protein [Pontibacillus litoralis]KGX88560.1 esterase [Pontibacillus litoralis JSM 072002]
MTRPKIGIALGSGGARGFAHLGVLNVLQQENIPIDMVAGTSMGALVGAFYCAGQEMETMYRLARTFKRKYYTDITVPKMGFIQGKRIKELIRMFTFNKPLEALDIPLSVIATDIYNGEKVVFTQGNVAEAVRASISIPGIFVPEKVGKRLLIDGGVVDRLPISTVKQMGADIIIAVDCAHFHANDDIASIFDVIMQSLDIMQDEFMNRIPLDAHVVMRPNVAQFSSRAYTGIEAIIKEGEKEAALHIATLKNCIANWKESNHESE